MSFANPLFVEVVLFLVAVLTVYIVVVLIRLASVGRRRDKLHAGVPHRRRAMSEETPAAAPPPPPPPEDSYDDIEAAIRQGEPSHDLTPPPPSYDWDEVEDIFAEAAPDSEQAPWLFDDDGAAAVADDINADHRTDPDIGDLDSAVAPPPAIDPDATPPPAARRAFVSPPPAAASKPPASPPPATASAPRAAAAPQAAPASSARAAATPHSAAEPWRKEPWAKNMRSQSGFGEPLSEHLVRSDLEMEIERMRDEMQRMRAEMEELRAARRVSPQYAEAMELSQRGFAAQDVADQLGISLAEAELVHALSRGDQDFAKGDMHGEEASENVPWDDGFDSPGQRDAG